MMTEALRDIMLEHNLLYDERIMSVRLEKAVLTPVYIVTMGNNELSLGTQVNFVGLKTFTNKGHRINNRFHEIAVLWNEMAVKKVRQLNKLELLKTKI